MQLPALAIQQPDLGKTLAQAAAIKGQRLQNRLMEGQIGRGAEVADLSRSAVGADPTYNALQAGGGPTPEAAGMLESGTAPNTGVNMDAMKKLTALDPKRAKAITETLGKLDENQRKKLDHQNKLMGQALVGVLSAPPEQQAMAYAQGRAQLERMGVSLEGIPEQWQGARWGQMQLMSVTAIDDTLKMQKAPAGFERTGDGMSAVPGGPADPAYLADVAGAKAGAVPQYSGEVHMDEQVGKYFQVNPKTGKREYISPNEEFLIESDGKGGLRISKGATGTGDLTTKEKGAVQAKIRASRDALARLGGIKDKFREEYQQIPTRLGAAWTGLKAKLGKGEINKDDRLLLEDFAAYKQEALSNLNLYIKETTGAQMSEAEANRLRKAVPDPGEGIFDGDDPISFKSKLDNAIKLAGKAAIRYAYYLEKGVGNVYEMAEKTPLDEMKIAVNPKTGERLVSIEGEWIPLK